MHHGGFGLKWLRAGRLGAGGQGEDQEQDEKILPMFHLDYPPNDRLMRLFYHANRRLWPRATHRLALLPPHARRLRFGQHLCP